MNRFDGFITEKDGRRLTVKEQFLENEPVFGGLDTFCYLTDTFKTACAIAASLRGEMPANLGRYESEMLAFCYWFISPEGPVAADPKMYCALLNEPESPGARLVSICVHRCIQDLKKPFSRPTSADALTDQAISFAKEILDIPGTLGGRQVTFMPDLTDVVTSFLQPSFSVVFPQEDKPERSHQELIAAFVSEVASLALRFLKSNIPCVVLISSRCEDLGACAASAALLADGCWKPCDLETTQELWARVDLPGFGQNRMHNDDNAGEWHEKR